jgi:anti-anti-sigma regulatory factor
MEPGRIGERRRAVLHLSVTHPEPEAARVALSGDLDPDEMAAVERMLEALDLQRVVFDLTDVARADDLGIHALHAAAAELTAHGIAVDVLGRLRKAC